MKKITLITLWIFSYLSLIGAILIQARTIELQRQKIVILRDDIQKNKWMNE